MKKIKDFVIILASLSIFAASTTYVLQVMKVSRLEQEMKDKQKEYKKEVRELQESLEEALRNSRW